MNIVLLGFMGVGKTTYGRLLAQRLGMDFIDTDARIEEHCKQSVSEIFTQHGEAHFRSVESTIVDEVAKADNCVIATGGGVIASAANVHRLQENGFLVGLLMEPQALIERLRTLPSERPLIANKSDEEITKLITERLTNHFFCHVNLEVRTQDPEEVVLQIMQAAEQFRMKKA